VVIGEYRVELADCNYDLSSGRTRVVSCKYSAVYIDISTDFVAPYVLPLRELKKFISITQIQGILDSASSVLNVIRM